MHGQARLVERKIRLWILQQELDRQKQGPPVRIVARGDAPAERSGRAVDLRE